MSELPDSETASQWLDRLQEYGYRLTAPRMAVVEVIASTQRVLTPLEIYELTRSRYPKIGLVTVYRTVEKLEELGLLQRVHQPSGCQGFVAAFTGHQHLLICQTCGLVEYFTGDHKNIDGLMDSVAEESGYEVREHWLQLFGVCADCQED